MKIASIGAVCTLALVAGAQAGIASANGYATQARLFNDQPGTTLEINDINRPVADFAPAAPLSSGLKFEEQFTAFSPGNNTNKHVGWFSDDAGATRGTSNLNESFKLSFSVRIDAPAGSPRKEAGIEVAQPRPALGYTDEGQVLIASDGEVAVFGGTMPFSGLGFIYTLGTTAQVTFTYFAPGLLGANGAYQLVFNDAVTGLHDSGVKFWGTEPDGINGFDGTFIGLKAQNSRNPFINDSSVITYGNVAIPSPAGISVLACLGLAAARRRRA